ncbi:MAG: CBM9 family sugar-binding protein, partial [Sedimentisphaerales bacterium]|nr:CBM9 family sugar-binding protein [Sedimentisphaerales bacterium]
MFKKLSYLACFVLLFGMTAYTYAQNADAEILNLGSSPLIDGKMDSLWSYAEAHRFTIYRDDGGTVLAALPANDLSGSWRACWDDQNLYFFVDVNDDVLTSDSGTTYYQDDSFEVFLDIHNNKATTYVTDSDDYQFRFNWDPTSPHAGAQNTWQENYMTGFEFKFLVTATGYNLELKMPWNTLYQGKGGPSVGDLMGMEVQVNDDDNGGGRDNVVAWIQPGNTTYQNPSMMGTVILGIGTLNAAMNPYPPDYAEDIAKDVILSWTPGLFADSHNIYFGTDFNDVNNATIASHDNVTLAEGLDVNNFDPGTLELGVTYYWRVDEVNAPSSPGSYKGQVWQFSVEPY